MSRKPDKAELSALVGEEIIAAGASQSAASRFSNSTGRGGVTKVALAGMAKHATMGDDIALPRFPVIAVGREAVHVVSYANGSAHEVATFPLEHLQTTVRAGLMWTRLVLADEETHHQAHVWIARFMPGRKETLAALRAT